MSLDEGLTVSQELPSSSFAVVVVDEDPKLRTRLAMQLGEIVHAAVFPSIEVMEEHVRVQKPTVLVGGPSLSTESGFEALTRYRRGRSDLEVVLVVEELSTQVLQRALRGGVSDVITVPTQSSQIIEPVQRASQNLPTAGATPDSSEQSDNAPRRGRAISVFSTKGGAGKSVIATNLACVLARNSERGVVLLDADLQFGDIAVMFKLAPQHTIVDAVAAIDRLDEPLLRDLLIKHEPSGVSILAAPTEPAFADQVDSATMTKIVDLLRSIFDYVIIDTPAHFNEVVLGLLEHSDDIVLVAGMDIPNIKNVKIGLQVLRLLEMPISKLKLVLNRSNAKVKLDISEVERTLQLKADALIPSDVLVPMSVNKGVPACLDSPKSSVAKSIEHLAQFFSTTDAQRARR